MTQIHTSAWDVVANPAQHSLQLDSLTQNEIASQEEDLDAAVGFWSAGELRAPYFVRPCRKRFDLFQLTDSPSESVWHQDTVVTQVVVSHTVVAQSETPATPDALPEPGRKKKSPRELEKILDQGIEDSMDASDPPAAAQPEVHKEQDRDDPPSKEDGTK